VPTRTLANVSVGHRVIGYTLPKQEGELNLPYYLGPLARVCI
jgi:hypothetical protein